MAPHQCVAAVSGTDPAGHWSGRVADCPAQPGQEGPHSCVKCQLARTHASTDGESGVGVCVCVHSMLVIETIWTTTVCLTCLLCRAALCVLGLQFSSVVGAVTPSGLLLLWPLLVLSVVHVVMGVVPGGRVGLAAEPSGALSISSCVSTLAGTQQLPGGICRPAQQGTWGT